jgi:hypothetical protein
MCGLLDLVLGNYYLKILNFIMKYIGLVVVFLFCNGLIAQTAGPLSEANREEIHAYEDTIALMGYAIVNDSLQSNRYGACKKLILTLKEALKRENSFTYKFDRVKTVSIQYPQDSSFRIFTWQLYVDKDSYRYFGAIQMNTPELTLHPLIDRSEDIENSNFEQFELTNDKWYGALYYKIKETEGPKGKYYLLFGFDGYKFFHKRKLIDVLTFIDGKPIFGAPVFSFDGEKDRVKSKKRFMLQYSPESSVTLNYDVIRELIIYDNLMDITGQFGEGPTKIPDGTYHGFKLENGLWVHVEKVFHVILEEAPVPNPILDKKEGEKKKDIFGRN